MTEAREPTAVKARDWRERADRGGHAGFCDGPHCRRQLDECADLLAYPRDDAWFCGRSCVDDYELVFRQGGT